MKHLSIIFFGICLMATVILYKVDFERFYPNSKIAGTINRMVPVSRNLSAGIFRLKVRLVVNPKMSNGKDWDWYGTPDPQGKITIIDPYGKPQKIWMGIRNNRFNAKWEYTRKSKRVTIRTGHEKVKVWFRDSDNDDAHNHIGDGEANVAKKVQMDIGQGKVTIEFIRVIDGS